MRHSVVTTRSNSHRCIVIIIILGLASVLISVLPDQVGMPVRYSSEILTNSPKSEFGLVGSPRGSLGSVETPNKSPVQFPHLGNWPSTPTSSSSRRVSLVKTRPKDTVPSSPRVRNGQFVLPSLSSPKYQLPLPTRKPSISIDSVVSAGGALHWYADVDGQELTSVPEWVMRRQDLRVLRMQHNKLHSLPQNLGRCFAQLQQLVLRRNFLSTLPESLFLCTRLQVLDAGENTLMVISSQVRSLIHLRELRVDHNRLTELPGQMCSEGALPHLHTLDVHGNMLQALPDRMDALSSLTRLSAASNFIKMFPKYIINMKKLEYIDMSNNLLSDLPFGQLFNLLDENLKHIELKGNQRLKKPPPEVCDRGGAAVVQYLHTMSMDNDHDENTDITLGLLGEMDAGKTTLLSALRSGIDKLSGQIRPTLGIEFVQWDLSPEIDLSFQIYDFSGLAIYHQLSQLFLTRERSSIPAQSCMKLLWHICTCAPDLFRTHNQANTLDMFSSHIYVYVYIIYAHSHLYIYVYMYICTYVYVCICLHVYIYKYTHTYTHSLSQMHTCIHTYTQHIQCVCMYVCKHTYIHFVSFNIENQPSDVLGIFGRSRHLPVHLARQARC
jgi:Leucine-rich repeat (LRR) protein